MCVKLRHGIFQRFNPYIFKLVLNKGGTKMCVFQRKTGHISETVNVRDTAKITINYQ